MTDDHLLSANGAFYAAFEMLDFEAMQRVWSDRDDVSCIHPGGELIEGRTRVLASWRAMLRATTRIHFTLADVHAFVSGDTAWVVLVEEIETRQEGRVIRAAARATNVFTREAGGWRLVHHHAEPARGREARAPASVLN